MEMLGAGPDTLIVPNTGIFPDLEPLARRRRVVAVHSRSRGLSDRIVDPDRMGVEVEAGDVDAVRDHLGLDTMLLLGWSYVGFVAALYATRHPERVNRLVLMSPAPPYRDPTWPGVTLPEGVAGEVQRLRESGLLETDPAAACREFMRLTVPYRMGDPAAFGRWRTDVCQWENEWPQNLMPVMGMIMGPLAEMDLRSQLHRIEAPTLIVHGDADQIPLAASEAWAQHIPNARLLRIAGAGHYPHVERPEVFFPAVEEFLAGNWPP
jgi:pimeloyl-ACP methyl ester carboxylesterase